MPSTKISGAEKLKRLICNGLNTQIVLTLTSSAFALLAYFMALGYFWSCFEWSPFGYETCGLEIIVWPFFILPALLGSFAIKAYLFRRHGLSFWFLIYPLMTGLFFIFTFSRKSLAHGILSISFMALEIVFALICICAVLNSFDAKKQKEHAKFNAPKNS